MQGVFRILAIASLLAFATGSAHAQSPTYYLGVDFVRLSTKVDDHTGVPPDISGTATAPTLRLKGGMHIIEYLDAEVHWVLSQTKSFSNTGVDNTVSTDVLGIYAKPNYSIGDLNLYALAGYSAASVKLDGTVAGTQSLSGFSYGVGLQYNFTKNWAASIDYIHYFKDSKPVAGVPGGIDVKADAFGVGVIYNFR